MARQPLFPAQTIALLIVTSFGVVCLGHVLLDRPLTFVTFLGPGIDYLDFFISSQRILDGLSPYDFSTNRYVTTPVPAILNIPFLGLGLAGARNLFYLLIP